jgi:hypothetical protein
MDEKKEWWAHARADSDGGAQYGVTVWCAFQYKSWDYLHDNAQAGQVALHHDRPVPAK